MAKKKVAKRGEPRPVCKECGCVVNPKTAQAIYRPKTDPVLRGIYCCSDCLLDAWLRGFPHGLLKRR